MGYQMYLIGSAGDLPLGLALELKLQDGRKVNIDILGTYTPPGKNDFPPKKVNKQHRIKKEQLQKKVGTSVNGYSILEYLDRDKMIDSFKALQISSNQEVILEFLTGMPDQVETTLKLTELLKDSYHPNLIHVCESGYDKNLTKHYLVTEFLEARSLEMLLQESSVIPLKRALKYCMQIAKGIEALHSRGILHIDINPEHFFVTSEDTIKIGFSFFELHQNIRNESDGLLKGTPLFMSPEQCVGSELGITSDIYGMGVLFYKLTTGQHPFIGQNSFDILEKQIAEEPVPPNQVRPEIPFAITEIILKMLKKKPGERFQNCGELIEKLTAFIT